uniref:Uncharacterized protein n=1 Tax=Heterorhabditis bacteriophora TaxID=37862 RepID=A0A1I7X7Q0_HETBA
MLLTLDTSFPDVPTSAKWDLSQNLHILCCIHSSLYEVRQSDAVDIGSIPINDIPTAIIDRQHLGPPRPIAPAVDGSTRLTPKQKVIMKNGCAQIVQLAGALNFYFSEILGTTSDWRMFSSSEEVVWQYLWLLLP